MRKAGGHLMRRTRCWGRWLRVCRGLTDCSKIRSSCRCWRRGWRTALLCGAESLPSDPLVDCSIHRAPLQAFECAGPDHALLLACAAQVVACEESPSPQEIMERYILENRPGLFRGLLDDWPAQQRWVRYRHPLSLWLCMPLRASRLMIQGPRFVCLLSAFPAALAPPFVGLCQPLTDA